MPGVSAAVGRLAASEAGVRKLLEEMDGVRFRD